MCSFRPCWDQLRDIIKYAEKTSVCGYLLIIWNSLSSGGRCISYLRRGTLRIVMSSPLIISTSFGMKLMSSCTSRHGCRASFRTRLPDPAKICQRRQATVKISLKLTLFQDLRPDIRLRSIDSNVGEADNDVEICDDVVPSLQYRRVGGYTLSATCAHLKSPHTLTCNVHHLLHEPALCA